MRYIPLQLLFIAACGTTLLLYLSRQSKSITLPPLSEEIPETYGVTETPAQLMERFRKQNEEIKRRIGLLESEPSNKGLWQSLKQRVGLTWKSKTPETETEKVTVTELTKEELSEKIKEAEAAVTTVGDKVKGFVKENLEKVKDTILDESKEKAKEGLQHAWRGTKHVGEKVGRAIGDELHDMKENIKEKVEFIEETVKEDMHRVKEGAKDKLKEGLHKVYENIPSTHHGHSEKGKQRGVEPEQIKDELSMIQF